MRVIAGSVRGTKLHCLEGIEVRPTLDRVKEAVFSMLTAHLTDARVLDLFSGSGSLGIEALSRGAHSVVFVDNYAPSLDITKKNLHLTGFIDKAICIKEHFLDFFNSHQYKFDIIFLDPPYGKNLMADALEKIKYTNCLNENGLIVCELDTRDIFDHSINGFEVLRDKKYGRVRILLMKEM